MVDLLEKALERKKIQEKKYSKEELEKFSKEEYERWKNTEAFDECGNPIEKNSILEDHPIKHIIKEKKSLKSNISKSKKEISIDAKRGFYYFSKGKVNRKLTSEQLDKENKKILDPKEFAKTMRNIFDYLESI